MFAGGDGADERFRGLLLQLRGRTGLTQRQLAARLQVHPNSVQAWEAGVGLPGATSLRALIRAAALAGMFAPGREADEAATLWNAAARESSRRRAPFDRTWFDELLQTASLAETSADALTDGQAASKDAGLAQTDRPPAPSRRQSWGEAPDVAGFVGRRAERNVLARWLDEQCRVVGVVGLGGMGKSLLVARLAQDVSPHFDAVYWRSLRDGQATGEWLTGLLGFLAPDEPPIATEAGQIARLLEIFGQKRCLIVLDDFETMMQAGISGGGYADGSDGFGTILRSLGETVHRSCLVLVSREAPLELSVMRSEHGPVRRLDLGGLSVDDGRQLLREKRLEGDVADWESLIASCGGNGLALKITGESIRDLFGGSIPAYLEYARDTPGVVIGPVRPLVASQVERLSALEREVLRWLAVERQPFGFAELAAAFNWRAGRGEILQAVEGLRRRSLLERGEQQAMFALHSVILEFITEELIDAVAAEIVSGDLDRLRWQPLVKATARDYVRRSQERLIAGPVLDRLSRTLGGRDAVERLLVGLLDALRRERRDQQGYASGTIVNLLWQLRGHLRQLDLSGLEIRQAFLQGVEAQDASLAGAHLSEVVLAEAFRYPTSVTLSADGAYLAAGTSASEVCLWRVADRTLLATLQGHTGGIRSVALSHDNRLIASGSFDGTARIWDVEHRAPRAVLRGHDGLVYAVTISRDGRIVASGGQDGTVRLWQTDDGRALATLAGHAGGVWGVSLSDDGRLLASGSEDGTVRLWDSTQGRLLLTLTGHTRAAHAVALSGDGRLLVSGSLDGSLRLWDTSSGALLATMTGHAGGVRSVSLTDDGQLVASGSLDGTVRLWSTEDGSTLAVLRGHVGLVYAVALSGTGDLVASGSFDGTVKLWDTSSGRLMANLQGYNRSVRSVAASGDGRLLVSGGFDGVLKLWDAEGGSPIGALHGHTSGIRDVALSADGRLAASGSFDGTVRLWDIAAGRTLVTIPAHTGGVWGLALSGDGRMVATGGYDGAVKLWDAEQGRLLISLSGHASGIRSVALSGNGRLAASGSEDATVRLWDTHTGDLLATLTDHTGGIWSVALSRDGRIAASGSDDRTVRLWDTASGRLLRTLNGHDNVVWGVALADDGDTVASASFDGLVRVWSVADGQLVATLRGHDGRVCGVALDAHARHAASAGVDGTILVWDVEQAALQQTLRADRRYERLDITGLTGVTEAQREAMLALGAIDRSSTLSKTVASA